MSNCPNTLEQPFGLLTSFEINQIDFPYFENAFPITQNKLFYYPFKNKPQIDMRLIQNHEIKFDQNY